MHAVWKWLEQDGVHVLAGRATEGWELVPLEEAGETIGAAFVNGMEIHFVAAPSWRGRVITRKRARAFLAPLFHRHGLLTTRVPHGASGPDVFVRRMGFKATWSDDKFNYFMLTQLPFERSKP